MSKFFIKKAEQVEAVQWNGKNEEECLSFCPSLFLDTKEKHLKLFFPPNEQFLGISDWIVKDKDTFLFIMEEQRKKLYKPVIEIDEDYPYAPLGWNGHKLPTKQEWAEVFINYPQIYDILVELINRVEKLEDKQ